MSIKSGTNYPTGLAPVVRKIECTPDRSIFTMVLAQFLCSPTQGRRDIKPFRAACK